jgi:hypothetical protein
VGSLLAAINWRSRVRAEFAMSSYTNHPRAIYNCVRQSDDNFYSGNTRRAEAEIILGQTKAALEEMKMSRSHRLIGLSDDLLKVFPLIPESLYKRVFLFVRFCNVTTLYTRLTRSKRLIKEYDLNYFALLSTNII